MSTAPLLRRLPGQPISSAECLMQGTAHASHHAAPHPAPPHPSVNVDVGAPSVTTSAHANRASASGEVDVADDGTHAGVGVAPSEWLVTNLGNGIVDAGVHVSANNDAHSDDNDNNETSVLEVILGCQVGQHEDTACDEDGVDVSVGVNDDAVLGVGVHGQGVNLGVSLGVGKMVDSPPSPPSTLRGPV